MNLLEQLKALDPDLSPKKAEKGKPAPKRKKPLDVDLSPPKAPKKGKKEKDVKTQLFDEVLHETPKARLFKIGDKQFWLPKRRTTVVFGNGVDGIGHVDYDASWIELKMTDYAPFVPKKRRGRL